MDAMIKRMVKIGGESRTFLFDIQITHINLTPNFPSIEIITNFEDEKYTLFGEYDNADTANQTLSDDVQTEEVMTIVTDKIHQINPLTNRIFTKIVNEALSTVWWKHQNLDDEEAYKKMK